MGTDKRTANLSRSALTMTADPSATHVHSLDTGKHSALDWATRIVTAADKAIASQWQFGDYNIYNKPNNSVAFIPCCQRNGTRLITFWILAAYIGSEKKLTQFYKIQ